jgi:hypothetical protein
MDAYIKYLESAGARTVPLVYNKTDFTEVLDKIDHLNGILFPGGGADETEYVDFGKAIFKKV